MTDIQSHHTGIVVSDLEETVSFYRDTLGLSVAEEFTLAGDGIATAINIDDVTGGFAHIDAGNHIIELIEYDPAGDDTRGNAVNQLGAKHVGFTVDDIDAFYEKIPSDVESVSAPQRTESGATILFFKDPDGNFLEVVEA